MIQRILWFLLIPAMLLMTSCATVQTSKTGYNPQEFETDNYQQNVDNAVDALDSFNDFSESKEVSFAVADFSKLMQADIYYNSGNYEKAYALYRMLAFKYQDPRVIYKAVICLEHAGGSELILTDRKALSELLIKVAPNSKIAKLFKINLAISNNDYDLVKQDLASLLASANTEDRRLVFLYLSSVISNSTYASQGVTLKNIAKYVVSSNSDIPEAHLFAAVAYAIANQSSDLIHELDTIHEAYPNWRIPLYWSISLLANAGNNQTVTEVLEHVLLKQDPADPKMRAFYIAALINQGELQVANVYLHKELIHASSSDSSQLYLSLGIIDVRQSNYNQALADFAKVNLAPSLTQDLVYLTEGILCDYNNDLIHATQYYNQAINSNNSYIASVAGSLIISDYFMLKDYVHATAMLNKMAQANKLGELDTLLFRVDYLIGYKELSQANIELNRSYAKYKDYPQYMYRYAAVNALLGNKKVAISWYKKYLKLKPHSVNALNDLAYLYTDELGMHKIALSYAKEALAKSPLDSSIIDTVGWAYYKSGAYPEAYVYLSNAYSNRHDMDSALHLKAVYLALKRPDLANNVVIYDPVMLKKQERINLLSKTLMLLMYFQFGDKVNDSSDVK